MRVAVFGAGYAGLTLARRLEGSLPAEVDLVVVDESDSHLVQHELHRAIRRPSLLGELQIPLADVLDRAEIVQERVEDVAPERNEATLADGERIEYDVGAVCLGARTNFHGLSGVQAHATPLKRIAHAERIRADFLDATAAGTARVVVGGAGLSGVQVAGELAALAREQGVADAVEVVLLERLSSVAPAFPARFQTAVRDELVARDVTVRTDAAVADADAERIALADGTEMEYEQFVWTGGIRGPDALSGERPVVRSRLRLDGETFVVGDAARVVDSDGTAVPASAQAAVRAARVAAENAHRLVEYLREERDGFEPRLSAFRFDSPGWLVSVGDGAVAQVGSAVLTGSAARALKTTVGAGYLTSVGAIRDAVSLVGRELGADHPADEGDASANSAVEPGE